DARGKRVTRSTKTDSAAIARRRAQQWEAEALDLREGRVDTQGKRYLAEAGRPLPEHVQAFLSALKDKGNTAKHIHRMEAELGRLIKRMDAANLTDFTPEGVSRAVASLLDDGLSARSANAALKAAKQFGRWLEATGRIRRDDLK